MKLYDEKVTDLYDEKLIEPHYQKVMKLHYEKPMNQSYEKIENVEHYSSKRFSGRRYSHTHCREIKAIKYFFDKTGPIHSVIDIPCGAGRFQSLLGQYAKKITQMDYSSQMLCKAEENMYESLPNLVSYTNFIRGSIFDIPFEGNSFDLAFAIRIYHHFAKKEERQAILEELARVSKKWIIITFFNSKSYLQFRRNMKKKFLGKKPSRHAITIEQFEKDLAFAGLKLHSYRSILRFYSEQTLALVEKI